MAFAERINSVLVNPFVSRKCPVCEHEIEPIPVSDVLQGGNGILQVVRCPRHECAAIYVGLNRVNQDGTHSASTFPNISDISLVAPEIGEYYPDFLSIYKQASLAESQGLKDLAGMGYRKSVEFLVKEYLIEKYPDLTDQISKENSGASINRLSEYPEIRDLAKSISWVGNDETHMFQKRPDYSVPEMKKFIYALSHLIVALGIARTDATKLLSEDPKK